MAETPIKPEEGKVDAPVNNDAPPETPPETPPVETPPVEEKTPLDDPDHPRFKEVYWKMKENERQREKLAEDVELLKAANRKQAKRLDGLDDTVAVSTRPDPLENPEAYDEWVIERAVKRMDSTKEFETPPSAPTSAPAIDVKDPEYYQAMEKGFADGVPDYWAIVEPIAREMDANPALKHEIFSQPNPYKYAYEYGKGKQKKSQADQAQALAQAQAEGGTPPPDESGGRKLTEDEKRVAKMMEVPLKEYAKELSITEGVEVTA